MKHVILTITAFSLILNGSCSDTGTKPPDNNGTDTTSQNFEWRVDTLWTPNAGSIYIYDIWGSSENDVWAVGHSDDFRARIWHWDGTSWQNIWPDLGVWVRASWRRIIGFGEGDFWVVGNIDRQNTTNTYGALLHYNHGSWELYNPEVLEPLLCIWGSNSQNLFLGTWGGTIYNIYGTTLRKITTGIENRYESQVNAIWGVDEYTVYAKAASFDTTGIGNTWHYYFYKIEFQTATLVDSFFLGQEPVIRFGNALWGYDNVLFSGTGDGLFRYQNNQWQQEFPWTTIYDVYGSGWNNIFAGSYGSIFSASKLFHFNGNNWKSIENFHSSGQTIWAIWCNEENVFIVQDIGAYEQVIKGKLIKEGGK